MRDVLRRRWLLVVVPAILVPLLAVGYAAATREETMYEAQARVFIGRAAVAATLTGTQQVALADATRLAQTQAELATLPRIVKGVLRASGEPATNRDVRRFLARSNAYPQATSDFLSFVVAHPSRRKAMEMATEWARRSTELRLRLDTDSIRAALRDVREGLAGLGPRPNTDSDLYASLVDKQQQLQTMLTLYRANGIVAQPATDARKLEPASPGRKAGVGLLGGLALGALLAVLWEVLDKRVRSTDELGRVLRLPLLGTIPPPDRQAERARPVMLAEPTRSEAEAFRVLRARLQLATRDRPARTLMVANAIPIANDSATVVNLAAAFARSGKRVAVIDLNFRSRDLHRLLGVTGWPGLNEVILNEVDIAEALVTVPLSGSASDESWDRRNGDEAASIAVLPAGHAPPDAVDLIGSRAVEDVLEHLMERFDLVLVNVPPLLQVGDALALSALVDAIVVVIPIGEVRRPALHDLARTLSSLPAWIVGFVVIGDGREERDARQPAVETAAARDRGRQRPIPEPAGGRRGDD